MNYKKFGPGEILRNTIKAYPENLLFINSSGTVYIQNIAQIDPNNSNNSNLVASTNFNLSGASSYRRIYEFSPVNDSVSPLVPKNLSSLERYGVNTVTTKNSSGLLTSSINVICITSSNDLYYNDLTSKTGKASSFYLNSLRNSLNWYESVSPFYDYSNYENKDVTIINIPSVFYSSTIKRGSVSLDFYITGNLVGRLEDLRYNGELIQTFPSGTDETVSGSSAGVVLYDEGLILLSGSWNISSSCVDRYSYISRSAGEIISLDSPRWVHWGKSLLTGSLIQSSSYRLNFKGTNYISNITMFATAKKNEFNTSINKTAVQRIESLDKYITTSSDSYIEDKSILYKNTVKTPFSSVSGSYTRQSFISKMAIFDENKKLLGVVKFATPIKKNSDREYTFKVKLDI
jgi:hypothetical protein